jgi:hypothetical protein
MSSKSRIERLVRFLTSVVALGATLGGCSDIYFDRRETISLGANDANLSNQVTQMIDPWPRNSGNRNIAFSGERQQVAVERYRTHKVIRPVNPVTTDSPTQLQPPPAYTTEEVASPAPAAPATPAAAVK